MNRFKEYYKKHFGFRAKNHSETIIKEWEKAGKPLPPPHLVKQRIINKLQKKSGYRLFIETGTYLGDMVIAQKNNFKQIYSIELGEDLYKDAVKKFADDENVTILQGDSGDVLVTLCAQIKEPAIFWLDGHYSAGITAKGKKLCPIYEELQAIFTTNIFDHILLIDDARLFIGADDYPTVSELTNFIEQYKSASVFIEDDIIHVLANGI